MSSQELAPAAPATKPAFRVPAWLYAALALAVMPWLVYWIAFDPASPRWDGIVSLFIVRGPAIAIVAATVTLRLLFGIVRRWKAPPSDSAYFEPVLRRGGLFCLALAIGLGTQTSFATALVDQRASRLVAPPSAGADGAVVDLLRLESLHRYRIEQACWIGGDGHGRWVRQSAEGPR